jgi:hypothetical protein
MGALGPVLFFCPEDTENGHWLEDGKEKRAAIGEDEGKKH